MDRQNQSTNIRGSILSDSTSSDDYVTRKVHELIEQEGFRKRTIEIIVEHTDSVPFMEKVQRYADKQIDMRLFKNTKVVVAIIIGWIVTAIIAFIAAWLGKG